MRLPTSASEPAGQHQDEKNQKEYCRGTLLMAVPLNRACQSDQQTGSYPLDHHTVIQETGQILCMLFFLRKNPL